MLLRLSVHRQSRSGQRLGQRLGHCQTGASHVWGDARFLQKRAMQRPRIAAGGERYGRMKAEAELRAKRSDLTSRQGVSGTRGVC